MALSVRVAMIDEKQRAGAAGAVRTKRMNWSDTHDEAPRTITHVLGALEMLHEYPYIDRLSARARAGDVRACAALRRDAVISWVGK